MTPSDEEIRVLLADICARTATQKAEQAIERLYLSFSPSVRHYVARNWLDNGQDVDEVVQDTFWQVWTQPERYRGNCSFKTWLIAIARNKAIDVFRRQKRTDRRFEALDEKDGDRLADSGPRLSDIVHSAQLSETIKACMENLAATGKLSAAHFEVLHLAYMEDLDIGEIACITGQKENTIKSRLHYARRRMKETLTRRLGGDHRTGLLDSTNPTHLAEILFTA